MDPQLGAEVPEPAALAGRIPVPLAECSRTCLARSAAGSSKKAGERLAHRFRERGWPASPTPILRTGSVVAAFRLRTTLVQACQYSPGTKVGNRPQCPHPCPSTPALTSSTAGDRLIRRVEEEAWAG